MVSSIKKIAAALIVATVILGLTGINASAIGESPKRQLSVHTVKNTNITSYPSAAISLNGAVIARAPLINDTTYVPLRDFVTAVTDASITYLASTRTATVTARGLDITATDGTNIVYANGRPLYSLSPTKILSDGKMYVPIRSLAKALGLAVSWDGATSTVRVTGSYNPLMHASEYYNADDVYWLSRIISAESAGEPLLGQIAVGNVVRNRVSSPDFPNTVYSVIFDRKWGVQFTPVANGSIYNAPYFTSVIAAKICLEGFSVSGEILYFMEPTISTSGWIKSNRYYAFSIGHHDFYY